jgi:hypothetical protein
LEHWPKRHCFVSSRAAKRLLCAANYKELFSPSRGVLVLGAGADYFGLSMLISRVIWLFGFVSDKLGKMRLIEFLFSIACLIRSKAPSMLRRFWRYRFRSHGAFVSGSYRQREATHNRPGMAI